MSDRFHTHKIKEPQPLSSRQRQRLKQVGVLLLVLLAIYFLFVFVNLIIEVVRPRPPLALGATFSPAYARFLGLEPRATYLALLDELGARRLRLSAYWEEIEPAPGVFNFEELDWLLEEAAKHQARVILALGFKLPRWPECHAPAWVWKLTAAERQTATRELIRAIVNRYRFQPAIFAWQVENEPLLGSFGLCPEPDREFLKQEVALVRSLDHRPIILTESGELSTWLGAATLADILGISMYRVSWNPVLGYIYYPLTPSFYRQRARAARTFTRQIMVTELQAEPWVPAGILQATKEEQYQSMNPRRLKDNLNFVERAGFDEVYLWGVEWWYWLKEKQNDPLMWQAGLTYFRNVHR